MINNTEKIILFFTLIFTMLIVRFLFIDMSDRVDAVIKGVGSPYQNL